MIARFLRHLTLFCILLPGCSGFAKPTGSMPGYMMEMTMDFPVKDTNELKGISPGDKITFTLVISHDDEWVENIHGAGKSSETNAMSLPIDTSGGIMPPELKPGDLLPDGVL